MRRSAFDILRLLFARRSLSLGLLLSAACLTLLSGELGAARERKMEVLPAQTTAPSAVVIDQVGDEHHLRTQLRSKNEVVELSASSSPFSQAPTGTFGFIAPRALGMALVTQSPDLTLERTPAAPNSYEIHKLKDGSGMLVGFVAHDVMAQISPANRPKNIHLSFHSNPSEKAPYIAAVPLVKLMVDRMPVPLDVKNPESTVTLNMDLQGSANRKSPTVPQ